jgi:hypothetical protein
LPDFIAATAVKITTSRSKDNSAQVLIVIVGLQVSPLLSGLLPSRVFLNVGVNRIAAR